MTKTPEAMTSKMHYDIIKTATVAVSSIVFKDYPGEFTKEELEEIVSDTKLKACRSIGRYDSRWALSTWIGKIADNCVKDNLDYKEKRRNISQSMPMCFGNKVEYGEVMFSTYRGDEFDSDRGLTMKEFQTAVYGHINKLSDIDRFCLEKTMDNYKPKDIAAMLGCSSNAVSVRICNIRKKLKEPLTRLAREYGYNLWTPAA